MVGTSGSEVEVWSVVTGAKIMGLAGHAESVNGLSISEDQAALATFSKDGRRLAAFGWFDRTQVQSEAGTRGLVVYDVETRTSLVQIPTSSNSPYSFSDDGSLLASAASSESSFTIKIWKCDADAVSMSIALVSCDVDFGVEKLHQGQVYTHSRSLSLSNESRERIYLSPQPTRMGAHAEQREA